MKFKSDNSYLGLLLLSLNAQIRLLVLAERIVLSKPNNVLPSGQYLNGSRLQITTPSVVQDSNLNESSQNANSIQSPNKGSTKLKNYNSCHLKETTRQLFCKGSLDLSYFFFVRNEKIEDLIVENYASDSVSFSREIVRQNGFSLLPKWDLKFPDTYPKITGQLQLKNTIFQIDFILNMTPLKNFFNRYSISGEAFSTKFIKISTNLSGNLILKIIKNKLVVLVEMETTDSGSKWFLQTNLTLIHDISKNQFGDWVIQGVVESDYIPQTQEGSFVGTLTHVNSKVAWQKYQFTGTINLMNANLLWDVRGKLTWKDKKRATIPKAAFSTMSVKNIVFKNSDFFNEFDRDAFEGLKGVEKISFLNSKLEAMPKLSRLFHGLKELREIRIEDCTTPQLAFGTETHPMLKNLQKISYMGSGPLNFNSFSFSWLRNSNVTHLNLRNSHIVLAHSSMFVLGGVAHSLKHLDVSYSSLRNETDLVAIFVGLKLINLTAEGLNLKKVPTAALNVLKETLEHLSLRRNNFDKALGKNIFNTIFHFPRMSHLTELDLTECQINYVERGSFDLLPNLKILHLAGNNLENLQDGWFFSRPAVTHLDLSSNKLYPQDQTMNTTLNLEKFSSLQVLNLTNGVFKNPLKVIKSLHQSLRELFVRNTNLDNLMCDAFDKLTGIEVLELNFKKNSNSANIFLMSLFRNLKNLKRLNLQGCNINSASMYGFANNTKASSAEAENEDFPVLKNLEVLDLSFNNFKTINSAMFRFFPNLKILKLCGNGITTWKSGTFDFSSRLEGVYLNENKIERVTPGMKSDLVKLKYFKLGNNPFVCGPYVYEIIRIAKSKAIEERKYSNLADVVHESGKKVVLDWSDSSYVCYSKARNKYVSFASVEETFEDEEWDLVERTHTSVYLWILLAIIFGVVIIVGTFCRKILDIHLVSKIVRNAVALSFVSGKSKEPVKYNYNVFVSYSDKDRQWVIEKLIPRLQSDKEFKVCLHERDFQVGLSILENIMVSIDSSSNILLILSTAFLKSHWCQYEMHLAQHRLLENGRDELILILLEDIPQIKRPRILRYLMMTKTYLEWPGNSKNQNDIELFWNRLLKSLKL